MIAATQCVDESQRALLNQIASNRGQLIQVGPIVDVSGKIPKTQAIVTGWLRDVRSGGKKLEFSLTIVDINTANVRGVITTSETVFRTVTTAKLQPEKGIQTSV